MNIVRDSSVYQRAGDNLLNFLQHERNVQLSEDYGQAMQELEELDRLEPEWLPNKVQEYWNMLEQNNFQGFNSSSSNMIMKIMQFLAAYYGLPLTRELGRVQQMYDFSNNHISQFINEDVINLVIIILIRTQRVSVGPRLQAYSKSEIVVPSYLNSINKAILINVLYMPDRPLWQILLINPVNYNKLLKGIALSKAVVTRWESHITRLRPWVELNLMQIFNGLYDQIVMLDSGLADQISHAVTHKYLTRDVIPMETLMFQIFQNTNDEYYQELARTWQIVVPRRGRSFGCVNQLIEWKVNDLDFKLYIMKNIRYYVSLLSRQVVDYLGSYENYTDQELFEITDVEPPFTSRLNLVNMLTQLQSNEGFFICRSCRNAVNQQTLLLTELPCSDTLIIGFGTISSYRAYELEELKGSFHNDDEEGFIFRRPEDIQQTFSSDQMQQLLWLLQYCGETPGTEELAERIVQGLNAVRFRSNKDKQLQIKYRQLADTNPQGHQQYLYKLFEIGMYMRRWKGPGHPYPIYEKQTHSNMDPNLLFQLIWDQLKELDAIAQKLAPNVLQFTKRLPQIRYAKDRLNLSSRRIDQMLEGTQSANDCIRTSSAYYVGTAYHYLKLLHKITIPNLYITELEPIS